MATKTIHRFNHSYSHCLGNDCSHRDDCANHLAYLEAVKLDLKNIKIIPHCKDIELDYVRVRIEE